MKTEEMHITFWLRSTEERGHLEDMKEMENNIKILAAFEERLREDME
jgi:hypothetical protein